MPATTQSFIPVTEENLPDPFFDESEYVIGSYQRGGYTTACTIGVPGGAFPSEPSDI